MSCVILLHSTTGNTRMVANCAAERIRRAGRDCVVHNIVRSCYNHCPEGALTAWGGASRGSGRYPGPSRQVRSLFRGS